MLNYIHTLNLPTPRYLSTHYRAIPHGTLRQPSASAYEPVLGLGLG